MDYLSGGILASVLFTPKFDLPVDECSMAL